MTRILVTGAGGFIGRATLDALSERGLDVHAVDLRPAREPAATGVVWHEADLLDAESTRRVVADLRPTHLLHLAWYAAHRLFWTSDENLRWVGASLALLRAFRECGGRRATFAGTCAEYDWAHGWSSERVTPLAPATLYGVSKDALRRIVSAYAAQHDLSWSWGRVFFLHGPGEHPDRLVSSVSRALLRGEPTRCTHGRQVRDFMHVDDVGGALAALLLKEEVTGPVNVASGEARSLREVVGTLAAAAGRPELARFGDIEPPPGEPPLLVGDARRLLEEVGFVPRWSFDGGLRHSLDSWRAVEGGS